MSTLSGKQVENLGHRLRSGHVHDPADIALLGELLIRYNGAMETVANGLRSLGLRATTRLKSTPTIIDKLQRTPCNLRAVQDLAGARVVQPMTLDEQDAIVEQVLGLWPGAQVVDRRRNPSYGYRAVHIVPRIGKCRVEIQLRTLYQDTWAQIMERLGDIWGRGIRYGVPPNTPTATFGSSGMTRARFVNFWIGFADDLHRAAECENQLARLENDGMGYSAEGNELRRIINEDLGVVRSTIRDFYGFSEHGPTDTGRVTA